jgi:hypothetical protein
MECEQTGAIVMTYRRPFRATTLLAVGTMSLLMVSAPAIVTPAFALECPAPRTGPDAIPETPAQTQALSRLLASGDMENHIGVIVSDMRSRHPHAEKAAIVDELAAAYCPVVARLTGLGEAEKRARLDRFVDDVSQAVY